MKLTQLHLKNFTTFADLNIKFSPGINILIGQNGMGKTHILKTLYAACKTSKPAESLLYNLVKTFLPDNGKFDQLIHKGSAPTSAPTTPTIVRVSTLNANTRMR